MSAWELLLTYREKHGSVARRAALSSPTLPTIPPEALRAALQAPSWGRGRALLPRRFAG
jgi:hypothetical protein